MFKRMSGSSSTWKNVAAATLLVAIMLASTVLGAGAQEGVSPDRFESLSQELSAMEHLYAVATDGQTIVFDAEAAQKSGFSAESIQLAQETAALTNDIVAKALSNARAAGTDGTTISVEGVSVDMSQYPTLAAYNAEARRRIETGVGSSSIAANLDSPQSVCGSKTNPVPNFAAPWLTKGPYSSQSAAETQLRNWGYYRAWWIPGGDWTRSQTYQSSTCKRDTYRDHSGIPYKSGTKWYFKEQNYTGTVPGEPNPVLSALPTNWPYLTWPDYVLWWHNTY
jgi:hypothetical protein